MSLRWLALLLPLYSVSVYAYDLPTEIVEIVDNVRVVAFVNEGDIDDSANWKPAEGAPAYSVAQAVEAARTYAADNEEIKGAKLVEIALRQIPHHEGQWHYMVKLKSQVDDMVSYHYLVVLMNGKVIPALREPESIK